MQSKEPDKTMPRKKNKKKLIIILLGILLLLILLTAFLIPAYVSSERGRKTILARINSFIDGQANFDRLSMSWFKGIKASNVTFNDNAGQTSVNIKRITTKPRYSSILTGSLSLGKTIVDEPKAEINLISATKKA